MRKSEFGSGNAAFDELRRAKVGNGKSEVGSGNAEVGKMEVASLRRLYSTYYFGFKSYGTDGWVEVRNTT